MAEEQQKHRKESKGAFPRPAPVNLFIFSFFGAPTPYLPAQQQWQNAVYSFHETINIVPKVYF